MILLTVQKLNHMASNVVTADNMLSMPLPKIIWLWEDFLPIKGLAGLTGASDCGKSTFLRQLAIHICIGSTGFLDKKLYPRNKRVLYVSTEDDEVSTQIMLSKHVKGLNIESIPNLFFLFHSEDVLEDVKKFLKGNKVDMIVFDVWADTYKGNPNNWAEVRANLNQLQKVADHNECLILILHHNIKNSEKYSPDKNKMNGSMAIEAKLRSVMEIRLGNSSDERELTLLKGNRVSQEFKLKPFGLKLDNETMLLSSISSYKSQGSARLSTKYDKALWVKRFKEIFEKGTITTYDAIRVELTVLFPEEEVPSKTWFVDNLKDEVEGGA